MTGEHFDRHLAVNVRGALFGIQAALPLLSDGASVVLVGSIADVMGVTPFSTYGATKAALRSYPDVQLTVCAPESGRPFKKEIKAIKARRRIADPGGEPRLQPSSSLRRPPSKMDIGPS